jgi:hypothetical protein
MRYPHSPSVTPLVAASSSASLGAMPPNSDAASMYSRLFSATLSHTNAQSGVGSFG